jgi:hypothetical protein
MVSKTRMLERVKAFDWKAVREGLTESPALVGYRDERGRNWLHLCCGVDVSKRKEGAADSVKTADVLLKAGHGVSQPRHRGRLFRSHAAVVRDRSRTQSRPRPGSC